MNIVVLDGHTLNPGDLDWSDLRELGSVTIYDRSRPEEVVPRAQEANIVLTNKTVVTRAHILALRKLRYLGVLATGFNVVDIAAARERGIPVTNVPAYGTNSVAQMTMALLLELTQHVGHHAQSVREGRWSATPDFCYWDFPLVELAGRAFGVVGFGRIGQAVGALAHAFGMHILATPSSRTTQPGFPVEFIPADDLFWRCDVVSLHCPLTDQTEKMVNRDRLSVMKPSAFLLNTSRGGLIDEPALAEALNIGRIAGAGLDVLSLEPPPASNPLLTARNCLVTPHIAWATRSARARLLDTAVANVKAFMDGQPKHVVN